MNIQLGIHAVQGLLMGGVMGLAATGVLLVMASFFSGVSSSTEERDEAGLIRAIKVSGVVGACFGFVIGVMFDNLS